MVFFALFAFVIIGAAAPAAPSDIEWYTANGSGMLLEKVDRVRALRFAYAVSVQNLKPENAPKGLRRFYTTPWRIECRVLYEKARRVRTQWIFKDTGGTTYLIAVISNDGSGFIEWHDGNGYVVEEQRLAADGSGFFISYTYRETYLLKADVYLIEAAVPSGGAQTGAADGAAQNAPKQTAPSNAPASGAANNGAQTALSDASADDAADGTAQTGAVQDALSDAPPDDAEPPPPQISEAERVRNPEGPMAFPENFIAASGRERGRAWTDNYRYTRDLSLRAIERVYYDPKAAEKAQRVLFPRFVLGSSVDKDFVRPGASLASEFLKDVYDETPASITYLTDDKRRILSETRKDETGEIIGEISYEWDNNRVTSIVWKSKDDERKIEFLYNGKGERISEKDYRNSALERMVTVNGDTEIEELYLENNVALRAVWKDGKKISEERILNRRVER
jgi:hypothetical protein